MAKIKVELIPVTVIVLEKGATERHYGTLFTNIGDRRNPRLVAEVDEKDGIDALLDAGKLILFKEDAKPIRQEAQTQPKQPNVGAKAVGQGEHISPPKPKKDAVQE